MESVERKKQNPALGYVTDNHTIRFKVDAIVTDEQIGKAFSTAIAEGNKRYPQLDINSAFKMSRIYKQGLPAETGYIWLYNPKTFHALLGRNPDGSPRVEHIEDPNWVPLQRTESIWTPLPEGASWGDIDEEEQMFSRPPLIRIDLPPLMVVPPIILTAEQQKKHPEHLTQVQPIIEESKSYNVDLSQYSPNILKSSALPPDVTEEIIKREFQHFSHTGNVPFDSKKDKVNYPVVKIEEISTRQGPQRIAFVRFDEASSDASFAKQLMAVTKIKDKKGKPVTLYFNYAPASKSFQQPLKTYNYSSSPSSSYKSASKSKPFYRHEK